MHESLTELEIELCRLPGVILTRFVGGSAGRPLGATVYVAGGVAADGVRASVQAIASVHFDVDIAPSRMVIIEVGETSIVLPEPPAPSAAPAADLSPAASVQETAAFEPPTVTGEPPTVTGTTDGPSDSREALASAQQAVHNLLGALTASEPAPPEQQAPTTQTAEHADTIVVGNSDTAEAGPVNN